MNEDHIIIKPLPNDNELRIFMAKYFKQNGYSRTSMDYAHKWCIENLPLHPLTKKGIRAEREYTPKLESIAREILDKGYKYVKELLGDD